MHLFRQGNSPTCARTTRLTRRISLSQHSLDVLWGLDPWCLNPQGKDNQAKIPENKSSKITGSFPQKRNQLMLQWLKCKNNCTFRFIINLYENMSFLFTVLVPKLPFSFQQNINQTYCFKRHLANDLFEKNGVLSKWGRIKYQVIQSDLLIPELELT